MRGCPILVRVEIPDTPALRNLANLDIPYEPRSYGRVSSIEEAAAARGVDLDDLIKTLVVRRGPNDYLLILVPGRRVISWPKLRDLLGVNRISMPDADEAREVTGYERDHYPFRHDHAAARDSGFDHNWPQSVDWWGSPRRRRADRG